MKVNEKKKSLLCRRNETDKTLFARPVQFDPNYSENGKTFLTKDPIKTY